MTKQRLEQKQYQSLSPEQIQFLGLLQLPVISLEKRIEDLRIKKTLNYQKVGFFMKDQRNPC